jgi:hypothetical protein
MIQILILKRFERNQPLLLVLVLGLSIFSCNFDVFFSLRTFHFVIERIDFRFYEVYCEVEPKRLALEKANAELKAARDKLDIVNRQVAVSRSIVLS